MKEKIQKLKKALSKKAKKVFGGARSSGLTDPDAE